MKRITTFLLVLCALLSMPAYATLNVLACEPEWSALATEIGGSKIKATSATTALQDPHKIEARPGLIARARNADLLICTGLELEAGWLPILLQQSGNNRIAPGQNGYLEIGQYAHKLEVPARVDRSQGDVHVSGNPHIQMDPRNIAVAADVLTKRLAEIDPANAAYYRSRHQDFAKRWQSAMRQWNQKASPLRGVAVIEHHKNMEYLINWLGMVEVGTLEPKPGVEPGVGYLSALLKQLERRPAKMVLRAGYNDARPSRWLTERAKIPAVTLPFTVGGNDQAKDLFSLFDNTLQLLLEANK